MTALRRDDIRSGYIPNTRIRVLRLHESRWYDWFRNNTPIFKWVTLAFYRQWRIYNKSHSAELALPDTGNSRGHCEHKV